MLRRFMGLSSCAPAASRAACQSFNIHARANNQVVILQKSVERVTACISPAANLRTCSKHRSNKPLSLWLAQNRGVSIGLITKLQQASAGSKVAALSWSKIVSLQTGTASKQIARKIEAMASQAANQVETKADGGVTPAAPVEPAFELIGTSGVKVLDIAANGLEHTAGSISGLRVEPLPGPSAFIKPQSIHFQQRTRKRRWDMVESHASVSILLYHRELEAMILVRQFRPAVYVAETKRVQLEEGSSGGIPLTGAFTYELCAGILDKPGLKLEEVAREEVREECGYDVTLASVQKLTSWLSAVGISGARQTCFYAEIDESMRVGRGGGNVVEGEEIDVVALPVDQIDKFIMDDSIPKSAGVMWATTWLLSKLKDEQRREQAARI